MAPARVDLRSVGEACGDAAARQLLVDESVAQCLCNRRCAVGDPELPVDVLEVSLDGCFA